jgi:hypothetical protein
LGTPSRPGSYAPHVTLTDAAGNTKAVDVRLTVARHLAIATKTLRKATVGSAYRFRLATRYGVRPVRWSVARGHLPAGLKLDATGTLRGVARASAASTVVFRARDAAGGTATKSLVVSAG